MLVTLERGRQSESATWSSSDPAAHTCVRDGLISHKSQVT